MLIRWRATTNHRAVSVCSGIDYSALCNGGGVMNTVLLKDIPTVGVLLTVVENLTQV